MKEETKKRVAAGTICPRTFFTVPTLINDEGSNGGGFVSGGERGKIVLANACSIQRCKCRYEFALNMDHVLCFGVNRSCGCVV